MMEEKFDKMIIAYYERLVEKQQEVIDKQMEVIERLSKLASNPVLISTTEPGCIINSGRRK